MAGVGRTNGLSFSQVLWLRRMLSGKTFVGALPHGAALRRHQADIGQGATATMTERACPRCRPRCRSMPAGQVPSDADNKGPAKPRHAGKKGAGPWRLRLGHRDCRAVEDLEELCQPGAAAGA